MTLTPHPLLPLPTPLEIGRALGDPASAVELVRLMNLREERIRQAETDPYRFGFELPHWAKADELLLVAEVILFVFGGNRAAKSEYAAKRVVQQAMENPGAMIMCLHESLPTSIVTQQALVWKYLPLSVKALNEKKHTRYNVRYTLKNGFADGVLILPNEAQIHFKTYSMDPADFEGWELGSKSAQIIGAWADEDMPLPWFKMLSFRLTSRRAKLLWTFTPVNGITPTIKELVGSAAKVLESRPAELLAGRVNVAGCPEGHMPLVMQPMVSGGKVMFFYSEFNPFGASYAGVKKLCVGKDSKFVMQRAYGYASDSTSRAFPNFSQVNVVSPEHLPAKGTNYMLTDPAGARNYAAMWVRVTPGRAPSYYIYRDWPSEQRYGEWAVTASNPNKFDGEPGRAQDGLGFGFAQYKQAWRECECVMGVKVAKDDHLKEIPNPERDPYRRWLALRTALGKRVYEEILMRLVDPRAGRNEHVAASGGTCAIDEFARVNVHPVTGAVESEGMFFEPASGVTIDEGLTAINSLLAWRTEEPLVAEVNAPRLYVSSDCRQVIWAMQNWTGRDGEKGASKDFVDLVRYMAMSELGYVEASAQVRGGGSY